MLTIRKHQEGEVWLYYGDRQVEKFSSIREAQDAYPSVRQIEYLPGVRRELIENTSSRR